ncbi:MAG TPA: UDP-galactopyranose mutase, partial [Longimicrobium sp.]|nr:UDP-galactopyranose mutase [Longimicrobium sp.]
DKGDPYYPVPTPENAALYAKYQELAEATTEVKFLGRLGTYKYYNMDQVVAQALSTYRKIIGLKSTASNGRSRVPATELAPA